ncbi:MAG TPA: glycosyltransferase family 2 protein [Acidobacteria bacterium]|nr:glycosyltransferase family 2 protein [Acidobacteriota bacterium]
MSETSTDTGTAAGSSRGKPIPELSAVMPAYNEEEVLPLAIEEAVDALEAQCERWELIVVDDGSTDRTPEIIATWHERDPRVWAATQRPNQGYTKALIRGFAEARYGAIFYTDADAQFDLHEISRLYPLLADHDMVAGYRIDRQDPWIRLLTSATYNTLQSWVLGVRMRDVNCAFKLFRRSFFDVVKLSSDGFLIDAELYARAKRAGLTWAQVGVTHRPREKGSTTVKLSTITETLRELWRLRRSLKT